MLGKPIFNPHMASESSAGFHHNHHQHQHQQQQGVVFESGAGSGGCQLIPMGNYYGNPAGSLNLSGSEGPAGGMFRSPKNSLDSGSTFLLNSVPGLKHDTGLAVEWSVDEQYKLEQELDKYKHEPTIMQYIKIAASLQDKTVRDVALRCSWMARKRRRQEDQSLGEIVKNRREMLPEPSMKNNISPTSTVNMAPHSFHRSHLDQSSRMLPGVLSGTTRHLLEENNQVFAQISANLSTLKLQENVSLFLLTRNNITKVLNDLSSMPGIMSRMPPLPVVLNDELASSIIPQTSKCCIARRLQCSPEGGDMMGIDFS